MTKRINQSEKAFDSALESLRKSAENSKNEPTIKPKKMKKETNMKKTIITTAVVTLVIASALVAQAFYFYNLGSKSQSDYNASVKVEAAKLNDQLKSKQ